MTTRKLVPRDYIAIGLYSVLLFIINAIVMVVLTPVINYAMAFVFGICLFFTAIVYLLMAIRVSKRGTLLMMALTIGLFYTLLGAPFMLLFFALAGLAGEATLWPGDQQRSQYSSIKRQALAYAVYGAIQCNGIFIMIRLFGTQYFEQGNKSPQEVAQLLYFSHSANWLLINAAFSFGCALLGCMFAHTLLKKHFYKSGFLTIKNKEK